MLFWAIPRRYRSLLKTWNAPLRPLHGQVNAFIVADLPFGGSYEASPRPSAHKRSPPDEGRCTLSSSRAVHSAETVKLLTEAGIQSSPRALRLNLKTLWADLAFKAAVKCTGPCSSMPMHCDAGAFAVVFEMVPRPIATQLIKNFRSLRLESRGSSTDGQVWSGRIWRNDLMVSLLSHRFLSD